MTNRYTVEAITDMHRLAVCVAHAATSPALITLSGDLGAGKTTFAHGFINALCETDTAVTSPTFNLVQPYDTSKGTVWHCDLYRLEQPEELYSLGLDEMIDSAICLIEWPEKAEKLLPPADITTRIEREGDARCAVLDGPSDVLQTIAQEWNAT